MEILKIVTLIYLPLSISKDHCEKDKVSTLWRASLKWGGSGVYSVSTWKWWGQDDTLILSHWPHEANCSSTWVDFSPSNLPSTWLMFKGTLLWFYIIQNTNLSVANYHQETWPLQSVNPSLNHTGCDFTWACPTGCVCYGVRSLTWLQPEKGRVSCPCRLPGWSLLHYQGSFQPGTRRRSTTGQAV